MDIFKNTILTPEQVEQIIEQDFTPEQAKEAISGTIQYCNNHNIPYETWQLHETLALYSMLEKAVGDRQKAHTIRDYLFYTAFHKKEYPWDWITFELRFEIWVANLGCRMTMARALLRSYDPHEIEDEMLDAYNERIRRFSNHPA